jgi:hypothetical protein
MVLICVWRVLGLVKGIALRGPMRYIRSRRMPCVEATTCPTAARSAAVVISVHAGDAVSRILAVWWKREGIPAPHVDLTNLHRC